MAGGFDSLGLMPELLKAVDDMSWILPTDVQVQKQLISEENGQELTIWTCCRMRQYH